MITIRTARRHDLDAVIDVGHRTWPSTYTRVAGADYVSRGLARWWNPETTLTAIDAGRVSVAEQDGQVVGMVSVGPGDGQLIVWKLYVVPDAQGGGAGSALLAHVLEHARASGVPAVRLAHLDGNERAAAFYGAKGFVVIGREPDGDGGPDSIWMELRLESPDGPA